MPDPDKAIARYRGASGEQYHSSKRFLPEPAYPWVARLRAAKLQPFVGDADMVFEYGVGLGWNLAALKCGRRLGYDVGEFLAPAVEARGIEFLDKLDSVAADSIDVAVCHHTLEHVLHPPEVLEAIRRVLKRGGKLLLFTPYETQRRLRRFQPTEPNHHLYCWNVQTLGNLAQETGFKVQLGRTARFRFDRFAAVWAWRLGLGERGYRIMRWFLLRALPEFEVQVVTVKE